MDKSIERTERLLTYLKVSPDDCFLLHALALEYIKEGRDEEARELFEKVLEKDPFYIGTYYQLGQLLERKGDVQAALHCYRKGMDAAKAVKSRKAYNELQAAWDELNHE